MQTAGATIRLDQEQLIVSEKIPNVVNTNQAQKLHFESGVGAFST